MSLSFIIIKQMVNLTMDYTYSSVIIVSQIKFVVLRVLTFLVLKTYETKMKLIPTCTEITVFIIVPATEQ
jgi:hypothetical protein